MPRMSSSLLLLLLVGAQVALARVAHSAQASSMRERATLYAWSIRGSRPTSLVSRSTSVEEHRAHGRQLVAIDEDKEERIHGKKHSTGETIVLESERGPTVVTTTKESWFTRMKNSLGGALFGIILIIFSIPVLWLNEKRNAMMECLTSVGESECKSVSSKVANTDMRGCLVQASDGRTIACKSVTDQRFPGAEIKTGCLRLSSTVEVYQWVESTSTETEEKLGGSKETKTTYSYSQQWSSFRSNSNQFKDQSKRNKFPDGLELGQNCRNCGRVEYGDGYVLADELVNQCVGWNDASTILPKGLQTTNGLAFTLSSDCKYYLQQGMKGNTEIGDTRVTFEFVPEGAATIMALQGDKDDGGKEIFLPYRLIERPCCGSISEEQKQQLLLDKARVSKGDLAQNETCGSGALFCICLPCNLVAMCCGGVLTAEIFNLWEGTKSKNECFAHIKLTATITTWLIRFLGWVMMFAGLYAFFSPVITLLSVIPLLSKFGAYAIWGLCFIITFTVAFMIIGLAYLVYHPLWGIMYLAVAGLIFALPQIVAAVSS